MNMQSFEAFDAHLRADRELMKAAHDASDEIERCELEYLDVEKELRELRGRVDNLEMGVTMQVANATDEGGKALFGNDAKRKAEVADRLASHNAYRDAVRNLAEAEAGQRIRRITIEKLLRTYSLSKLAYTSLTLGRREIP